MRFRFLLLVLAVAIAGCALTGCGGAKHRLPVRVSVSAPHVQRHSFGPHRFGATNPSYGYVLFWQGITVSGLAGYYITVDGTQVADVASSPYTVATLACATTVTVGVQAHGTGGTSPVYTSSYTTPACAAPSNSVAASLSGGSTQGSAQTAANGTWSNSPSRYLYTWQQCDAAGANCTTIPNAATQTYVARAGDVGHTIRAVVTAQNPVGGASSTTAASATMGATVQTGCFGSPGACGWPDPAVGNVGVADCSKLTPWNVANRPAGTFYSGSGNQLEITGSGVTLSGINFGNWSIFLATGANNFTLDNSCISFDGGGAYTSLGYGTSGLNVISASSGITGLTVQNSTIGGLDNTGHTADGLISAQQATVANDYLYNTAEAVKLSIGGTITNSYLDVNGMTSNGSDTSHNEDLYTQDSTVTLTGDTLVNPHEQTANIFANTTTTNSHVCQNNLTITRNFFAGGGYALYECSAQVSAGTGTMNVTGNHFSRCLGVPVTHQLSGGYTCGVTDLAGQDAFGYWPKGGYFGLDSYTNCPAAGGAGTWDTTNVWDDNGAAAAC